MRHLANRKRLDAYADGELRGWRLRRAERHLGACPICRAALDRLHASRAVIAGVLASERPPGSADAFWAAVRRGIAPEQPFPRQAPADVIRAWLVPLKLHPRLSLGSAVVAASLLAGIGVWHYGNVGGPRDPDPPVRVESLEGGPRSTVMLFSAPHSNLQVIWVFDHEGS